MSTINLNSEVAEQPPSQLQPKFGTVELAREIAKAWDNGASLPQYDFTYTSDDADLRGITDHESCETSVYSSDVLLQEIAAHSEESEKSFDLTRIVMGNAEMFLFRGSLFVQRVREWVKVGYRD